jgi:hypothetical protein
MTAISTVAGGHRRAELKRYAQAIEMWGARFDSADIAEALRVPEATVARWIANFREQMRDGR